MVTSLSSSPLRSATRLSGFPGLTRRFPARFVLARLSLLLTSLSMLSGCLVEDPPPYTKPTKTPPRLDLRLATPPPDQIIVAEQGEPIRFHIPFASEDAGELVGAYMFVDYSDTTLNYVSVPGSTLDDLSRAIDIDYTAPNGVGVGCHRILVRVSHDGNFARSFPFGTPIDDADVAEAYWWLNVIDVAAGDDGSILRNCPTPTAQVPAQ
jgi:hypothetical protein